MTISFTAAANEVGNAWHTVASHPFGALCWTAAAALVVIGLREISRGKRQNHRNEKELDARLKGVPEPPAFNYPPHSPKSSIPR